jgi:parvulin-like peptidyl-prolyl isomerase
MTSEAFLTVNEHPITLAQAVRYLQMGRKFDGFIGEILRQFVIEQELTTREDLTISPAMVEQSIIDFRMERQLIDAKTFQEWLTQNNLTYESFHEQVVANFKLRKLRDMIAEARLQEYFIERKVFLDRVVLSRIIVDDQDLAEELKTQVQEGTATFEQLAREYSLTDDKMVNGMVGPVSRGTMPDILRTAMDEAQVGDVVGPIGMEERWGLFRVEGILNASLDDAKTKASLQDELFEQWLAKKLETLPIKINLGE